MLPFEFLYVVYNHLQTMALNIWKINYIAYTISYIDLSFYSC